MSAFDPKPTSAAHTTPLLVCANLGPYDAPIPSLGGGNETARVHQGDWRRGGDMASGSACAAAERMRRIGVILPAVSDDLKFQTWIGSFLQALQQSGWT